MTSADGGAGTEQIAHHMQHCAAHVEVAFVAPVKNEKRERIGAETDDRDPQHQIGVDRLRVHKPPHRLEYNPEQQNRQQDAVDEGGQHLRPAVAEMQARVGGTDGEKLRACGQPEGGRIGQHVGCVREQRQRSGNQAADHLDDHKDDDHREGGEQPSRHFSRRLVMFLMVAVNHVLAGLPFSTSVRYKAREP